MQAGIELSLVFPEAAVLHHPSFRQHHESVQFVATSTEAPSRLCTAVAKGFPVYPPSTSNSAPGSGWPGAGQTIPAPARSVTLAVVTMGQPLSVHGDVALDSRHLLARVIALVLGAVGPGSPRYRSWSVLSDHCFAGLRQPIFFPAPEWNTSPGRVARSIAGNTCSRCANPGSPQAHPPLAPAFQEIEHPDVVQVHGAGLGPAAGRNPGKLFPAMSLE